MQRLAKCQLCGFRFKPSEVNKKVTLEMLFMVKKHLEQRGIALFQNLHTSNRETMLQTVRICSLCFSLVTAEYTLIETEIKLAQLQGIDASIESLCGVATNKADEYVSLLDPFLYQWRVMIHLDTLLDIPQERLLKNRQYFVQYKLFGYTISFPLVLDDGEKSPTSKSPASKTPAAPRPRLLKRSPTDVIITYYRNSTLRINRLRTMFLFSKSYDLDTFLHRETCEFRITEGDSWERSISRGTSYILSDCCRVDYMSICVKYSKAVLLFNPSNLDEHMQLRVSE